MLLHVALALLSIMSFTTASAQDDNWTGGAGSGNPFWDLASNWSVGLPVATSNVVIGNFTTTFRTGTVSIASLEDQGLLNVNGGTLTSSGPAILGQKGLSISGGQLNLLGNSSIAGNLTLSGGVFNDAVLADIAGPVTVSGGTLGGGGTTTISGATTFTSGVIGGGITNLNGATAITGAATKTFSSGLINTAAITTWSGNSGSGGNTINFNGATLDNTGTWQDQNSVSTTLQGVCCNGASTFNNMATYTKSGAGVTTVAAMGFNNPGTVNIAAGSLSLAGGGSATGTFSIANGTTLDFSGGGYGLTGATFTGPGTLLIGGATVSQSGVTNEAGVLNVQTGSLAANGTWNAASLNISGSAAVARRQSRGRRVLRAAPLAAAPPI